VRQTYSSTKRKPDVSGRSESQIQCKNKQPSFGSSFPEGDWPFGIYLVRLFPSFFFFLSFLQEILWKPRSNRESPTQELMTKGLVTM
jgi:hypothetical protein